MEVWQLLSESEDTKFCKPNHEWTTTNTSVTIHGYLNHPTPAEKEYFKEAKKGKGLVLLKKKI